MNNLRMVGFKYLKHKSSVVTVGFLILGNDTILARDSLDSVINGADSSNLEAIYFREILALSQDLMED